MGHRMGKASQQQRHREGVCLREIRQAGSSTHNMQMTFRRALA